MNGIKERGEGLSDDDNEGKEKGMEKMKRRSGTTYLIATGYLVLQTKNGSCWAYHA